MLRKSKKVREVVEKHKSSFQPLIKEFGNDKIIGILKELLAGRIFQSELRAKVEFPELFRSSPARDVQRTTSENDAARSEAEALEEIASLEGREDDLAENRAEMPEDDAAEDAIAVEVMAGPSTLENLATSAVPSLYPVNFPYKAQHFILTTTQRLLEECCFDFTTMWLPSKLQENGWDCPEAVELTKWTKFLTKNNDLLPKASLDLDKDTTIKQVLLSTHNLRHSAVHRLPTSARGINQMVISAARLAKTLRDPLRTAQLEELNHEVEGRIKDMELNKNFLEDKLDKELQDIRRKREELNVKEKELISSTLKEDQENKSLIGVLVQESLREILCDKIGPKEDQFDTGQKDENEDENGTPEISDSASYTAVKGAETNEKEE